MGSEATRDVVATGREFTEIVVADLDLAKAESFVASFKDRRLKATRVDATDVKALTKLIEGFDVVANCTTYHFGMNVTRAAIDARKSYLDLGGLYNTPKQLALDEEAKKAGVTILLGCGATPGVTNLMARYGASRMDKPREVHVAFCSYRHLAPSPGLLDTILDEFSPSTVRTYWENGEFVEVGPLTGAKQVPFAAPLGPHEVFYVPHSETRTMPRFIEGVQRVDVRGCWRPEIMRSLRFFLDHGLLNTQAIEIKGASVGPKEFLRAHILSQPQPPEPGLWAFYLTVQVEGEHKGRKVQRTYQCSHPGMDRWQMTATARMTGIPASIGAQMLARGRAKTTGVVAPEVCFEPEEFFGELAKRGIHIHETVHEEGPVSIG
ncbi:MAG: saccharopine dehydrogenase NADP-binding domain-containing protein [Candidatus Riflebacteria bacterium]|nr:saccharopine dehydrogenase NADP-binding domain-containing protein [Candidatus Riflebacteria bacterium]